MSLAQHITFENSNLLHLEAKYCYWIHERVANLSGANDDRKRTIELNGCLDQFSANCSFLSLSPSPVLDDVQPLKGFWPGLIDLVSVAHKWPEPPQPSGGRGHFHASTRGGRKEEALIHSFVRDKANNHTHTNKYFSMLHFIFLWFQLDWLRNTRIGLVCCSRSTLLPGYYYGTILAETHHS